MNLPHRFYYGPPRTGMAGFVLVCGAIAVVLAGRARHCGYSGEFIGLIPLSATGATVYYWARVGLNAVLGAIFAVLALILLGNFLARLIHPRTLELAADALLIPCGFLQKHTRRIAYRDIRQVREKFMGRQCALCITTAERTLEIPTLLLPGAEDYEAVKQFVFSHAPGAAPAPARPRPATALTRIEFMSRQKEAERQIFRQVLPLSLGYVILLAMVPAILGLLLLEGVLPLIGYPPEIQTALRVRVLWMLVFCAGLSVVALLANREGKRRFERLAFNCPACHKHLMFTPGHESLKTGLCAHCGEAVFY